MNRTLRPLFALSLLLLLGTFGCGGESTVTAPDPDGDEEEDEELAWDPLALIEIRTLMDTTHTSGFVLYFRNEIVAEGYTEEPDLFTLPDSLKEAWQATRRTATQTGFPVEDVAGVDLSVTALLVGRAVEDGLLDLAAPVNDYLGAGWSAADAATEASITVGHLVAMTSGLDLDLRRDAAPGTVWRYNEPAYRVLHRVIPAATGFDMQSITNIWLGETLGLEVAEWEARQDGSLAFYTTPRDLGLIGTMMLGRGDFEGDRVLQSTTVSSLVTPSQALNPGWGRGWWLNGRKPVIRADGEEDDRWLFPTAPDDMYLAIGDHDRFVAVIPSRDVILVRFGAWVREPDDARALEELFTLITQTAPR